MSFFDRVKSIFSSPPGGDPNALWLYVRCARCGTPLAVRVDLRNEPSIDYENGGYVLHKEMMDNKCFMLMHAEIRFDSQRKVIERTLDKGAFITRTEFEATTSDQRPTTND
jgi:hypothetical protein